MGLTSSSRAPSHSSCRNLAIICRMLELNHIPLNKPNALLDSSRDDRLGTIAFGASSFNDVAAITIETIAIPSQNNFFEVWRTDKKTTSGQFEALNYRHDDDVLFGSITLAETDFVTDATSTALQKATASAYRQIFELLARLSFRHLWRVWNFIPQINLHSDGIERYRQFNIERSAAFDNSGRATEGNVPAASAVGANGSLSIYFLAGRNAPIAIENPRQLSAYRYPSEYGPRSPIFSRASLIELDEQEIVFISGTASIVGHRTLHVGDVMAQTEELLLNIDAVLDETNKSTQRTRFTRADLFYRVYLRDADDFSRVQAILRGWLGTAPRAVYLQADICRADLMVEIEASGGHLMDIS
ncbi:MAG: hypothetical protein JWM78_399 [Verrucomicrobiaceae bacterium]|nr:hypothetical protein [Verrucomicrobiaceae bacterium]